ncbi:hypothetical protein ACFFJX_29960 [Pseudarcicella hirudinis]|uniref:hypothetical protein n=1 Tax=Pseudarcicella hirudinis TaxID=1079859 RepID=UPI0035E77781
MSLVNEQTRERVLPTFYDDNYISVSPGTEKRVILEYKPDNQKTVISIEGWNLPQKYISIEK